MDENEKVDEKKAETTPEAKTPEPAKVSLKADEYVDLMRQLNEAKELLAQAKREKDAEIERVNAESLKKLAEEKGLQAALEEQRKQLQARLEQEAKEREELRRSVLEEKRAAVVAEALAGKQFVSDAAKAQALLILQSRTEAVFEDGKPVIRDTVTKRPAESVLSDLVGGPDLAHFFAASNRGGAGTKGADKPADQVDEASLSPSERAFRKLSALKGASNGSIGLRKTPG